MNKVNFLIGIIALAIGISSCNNDDDNVPIQEVNVVKTTVQTGTWRITKFIDSGTDETNHFAGYNFTFNSSGVLNASNGSNSYDGNWSVTDGNSNDDSQDDLDFNINFNLFSFRILAKI